MALVFPHEGALHQQTAPLVRAGADALKSVANVLGSTQQNFTFQPGDVRSVETLTLQRLAEGKSDYLGFTITTAMQSSNAAIFELFPMVKASTITFFHEYYSFPKELAIATPAQAPPSYVEVEKRSREVTLERYALGATTTVQELRTAEGQFVFRGKLITVAVGFIEVAELLAIEMLLTTPSLYAQYFIEAGQHPIDLQRTGRMTDLYFDILRRRENGFAELVDLVRQSMSAQNIEPTHILMPEGLRSLFIASDKFTEYSRFGPGAADNARRLTDNVGDSFDGIRFIIISAVELPKKDLRIAPLERHTITGQHFRLDNFHDDCDLQNYCSKFMTTQVFSMETNTWATLTAEDGYENDFRFSRADGRLADWHYTLAEDLSSFANRSGVPIYNNQYDMFLYLTTDDETKKTVANVAALWGHMEKWALTENVADRVATTTAFSIAKVLDKKQLDAILAGLEDIRELYERIPDDADFAFLEEDRDIGRYGVPMLPERDEEGGGNYLPFGYGTAAGYLELANAAGQPRYRYIDQELASRALEFRKAAIALHKYYLSLYGPTHPALNPANAPLWYRNAVEAAGTTSAASNNTGSLLTFLSNIVDSPKATLYVNSAVPLGASVLAEPIDLEDAEDDADLASLNNLFDVGAPPEVLEALGTRERRRAFAQRFANSRFADLYRAYRAEQRTTTRTRARRGAGGAAAMSTDVEQTDPFADEQQGGSGEDDSDKSALARFHLREVDGNKLTPEQMAAFYGNVIAAVDAKRNAAPDRVTAGLLRGWARDQGFAQRARVETDAPADARPTALAASLDALRNSKSERIRNNVSVASPLNPARVVRLPEAGTEFDTSNTDLLLTSLARAVTSQARPAGANSSNNTVESGAHTMPPEPGVRGPPPRFRQTYEEQSQLFGGLGGAVPAFARSQFTDVVGARVVTNRNILDRFARYGADPSWQQRVAGQMFVLAPITKQTLKSFTKHNIAQPVAWLIEQFNRRYRTQSIIFASKPSNRDFGSIRYLDFDTHIGRNAVNKNLMVHVSGYMGATAEDVQDWFVAHDVAVSGYEGGENTVPFTQANWNINVLDKLPIEGPSMLWFMVPGDSLVGKTDGKTPTTHDIRGYSDPVNYRGTSVQRSSQFAMRPHYKSALYYVTLLELNRIVTPTSDDWKRFHRREGTLNTVTHQGLQKVIKPSTLELDNVIFPTDVFKDAVYPGARELRDGSVPRLYKEMNYESQAVPV